ncbi:hypothetical protein AVDCRST_MAG81-565 [uncultured Synechococcales cyanobacterium]|uniref:Uncharacterized protein n=1 Tax=uncultured Synechococcales cyanobacterium TaxID=1936017 RepID=A0A6J4UU82_9CYAN|nr:hypothetical protein AVDCRST_MAG81-565 [uncultured Synechococcales cyanobacterium]
MGDCWIGLSLADSSGLILAARVGKHTNGLYAFGGAKPYEELVVTTEGKTACNRWNSDGWGGYERVLPSEIVHTISKAKTQRLERTNAEGGEGNNSSRTLPWHCSTTNRTMAKPAARYANDGRINLAKCGSRQK